MADRTLIEAIVAGGIDRAAAEDMADRVFGATLQLLLQGKTVGIRGVGRLAAPLKRVWVPGSVKRQAREQRKAALRTPEVIHKGEHYAVER